VRILHFLALGAISSVLLIVPAHADTELIGNWAGPFDGVQVEIPIRSGPFDYEFGQPPSGKLPGPRFVHAILHIDFETQKNGLAVGTWKTAKFEQRFVCAQISENIWNCVDAGGRTRIELKSATEMRLCYLDDRQGAQGAGCARLRKIG
jgi:hypothetical protein